MFCFPILISFLALSAPLPGSPPSVERWSELITVVQQANDVYGEGFEAGHAPDWALNEVLLDEAAGLAEGLGSEGSAIFPEFTMFKSAILNRGSVEWVSRASDQLVQALVRAGHVTTSPRQLPDLAHGAQVFASACAACHGVRGDTQAPAARNMSPPPASFLDPEVMDNLTPYRLFNLVTHGLSQTAMPSFIALTEADRWAVSFYVIALRQPPCVSPVRKLTHEELATKSDAELRAAYGNPALACLRRGNERELNSP